MLGIGGRDCYLDRMLTLIKIVAAQIASFLRSRVAVQVENALLRHQVEILRRRAPRRVRVSPADRMIFKLFLRLWPRSAQFISIVNPKTIVRWHREGFRLYWRWKSRRRGGRPKIPGEIGAFVRQMSADNPLWGAPRLHGELLKLLTGLCRCLSCSRRTASSIRTDGVVMASVFWRNQGFEKGQSPYASQVNAAMPRPELRCTSPWQSGTASEAYARLAQVLSANNYAKVLRQRDPVEYVQQAHRSEAARIDGGRRREPS